MSRPEGGDVRRRPAVSVVMPIYNRADILSRPVEAVVAQGEQDWELLVVDDGSRDKPEAILERFDDPRIRLLRHSSNRGAAAARNTGIEAARADVIAFLDSDDVWHPDRLSVQLPLLRASEAVAMVCGVVVVTSDGSRRGIPTLGEDPLASLVDFESGVIHTSALMVKRSVLDRGVRFDEDLSAYQEYDFLLRLVLRGLRVEAIPHCLVEVRYDDERPHVSAPANQLRALEAIGAKYLPSMTARGRSTYYLKLMRLHLRLGDLGQARRACRRAVVARPLAAKRWPIAIGSMLGDRAFAAAYGAYERLAPARW